MLSSALLSALRARVAGAPLSAPGGAGFAARLRAARGRPGSAEWLGGKAPRRGYGQGGAGGGATPAPGAGAAPPSGASAASGGVSSPAVAPRARPAPRSGRGRGSSSSSQSKPFRVTSLVLFAPSLLAAYLCKWQLDRKAWKERILGERAERLLEPPVRLFEATEAPAFGERVEVAGTFDDSRSVFLGPRSRAAAGGSERGYYVITPLRDEKTGRTVLVNRGFVPAAWKDEYDRTGRIGEPAAAGGGGEGLEGPEAGEAGKDTSGAEGSAPPSSRSWLSRPLRRSPPPPAASSGPVVTVTAILSEGENPGNFVPDNSPETGVWYWAEPAALARHAGLPDQTPYLQAVSDSKQEHRAPNAMELLGGRARTLPRPTYPDPPSLGDIVTTTVSPEDHRNYALTWGSLSLATALLALKAIR